MAKFVSQFSPKLCKLDLEIWYTLCRMSYYIVGLRLRVIALFFYIYPFFFLSLYYMLTLEICVGVFSGTFKARIMKLGIRMDNELLYYHGIENRTPCSYSTLYLSFFLSSFLCFCIWTV